MKFSMNNSGNRSAYQQQLTTDPLFKYQAKMRNARMYILIILALTVLNILFAFIGTDSYFLFSASIPYQLTVVSGFLCGKLPDVFYEDIPSFTPLPDLIFYVCVAISLVVLALYLISFLCTKRSKAFYTVAAILFTIDCVFMAGVTIYDGFSSGMIIDILLHGFLLYSFIVGAVASFKAKKLEKERNLHAPVQVTAQDVLSTDTTDAVALGVENGTDQSAVGSENDQSTDAASAKEANEASKIE